MMCSANNVYLEMFLYFYVTVKKFISNKFQSCVLARMRTCLVKIKLGFIIILGSDILIWSG